MYELPVLFRPQYTFLRLLNYRYRRAVKEVLEETRLAATDPFKLAAISFFDNKFAALVPLKIAHFLQ